MNKFKKILLSTIIIVFIFIVCVNSLNSIVNTKTAQVLQTYKSYEVQKEKLKCTKSDYQNIQTIANEKKLDFYSGTKVNKEISKFFNDSRIPSSYKISISDIEDSYAIVDDATQTPYILMLNFKQKAKYDKLNEFLSYGEIFVGYSKRNLDDQKKIFLGNTFNNLNDFYTQYNLQKCY